MSTAIETDPSVGNNSKVKRMAGLLLGIAISVGILAVFVFSIDWQAFAKEMANVNLLYIPVFSLLFLVTYYIRAYRWQFLLPNGNAIERSTLFDAFSLGSLAMFLLPFRAGEIVRAFTLQRWARVPFAVGFASVVTERAFDVLSLLILFGICLTRIEEAPQEILTAAWALGGLVTVILVVMLACYFFADQMLSLFRSILRAVLRDSLQQFQVALVTFAGGIIEGFRAIRSTKELVMVFFSSLVLWLVFGLVAQAALWCLSDFPSLWVGITVSIIIALAIAIPSAPGFLGVFQLGCVLGLSGIFGYSKEFALAYAVLSHSMQYLLVLIIGFWVLKKRGLRLKELFVKNEAV